MTESTKTQEDGLGIKMDSPFPHHPESLSTISAARVSNPLVHAVLSTFEKPGPGLSWTATLEYLCAQLIGREDDLQKEILRLKASSTASRIVLANGLN